METLYLLGEDARIVGVSGYAVVASRLFRTFAHAMAAP